MTLNVGNLQAKLSMDTKGFKTGVAQANAGMSSMQQGFLNLKTVALASVAAIGIAVAGIGTIAVKSAAEFEKSMTEVFTLLPNESQKMYDGLNAQTKDFAKTFGVSLDEVSGALYQTVSAGVEAGEAFEFLSVAQKAAEGGVTDLTTAVDGITSVTNAYGSEVISATEASDLMFTAVKLGKTTFGELSASISDVVPTATGLGLGFENITAAMSTMTAQGTTTQKASTFLNQALSEMSKSGQKGFESFKLAAGKTFPDFVKEGGNLSEAMQLLSKYSEETGTSFFDMFGSVEASKAVLQLTGKGAQKFASDLDAMTSSAGATEAAFEKMEGPFSKRLEKLAARFEVTGVEIGEAIIPHLETLMDWVDANEEELMAPLLDSFAAVGTWWTDNGEGIITSITDAFRWLRDTFQPFVDMYTEFWGNQAKKMTEFWDEDGTLVMAALENIRAAFQVVIEYIAKAWEWLWPYLEDIIGPFVDVVLDLVGVFAALFAGDWDTLKTKLVDLTIDLVDLLYGVFSLGFDLIMIGFEAFANGVLALLTSAWNLVLGSIEGMINKAVDMLNGLIKAMNKIPGVNIPLIAKVSFERAEAPTVTMPRAGDLLEGKTPGEIMREKLGIEEPAEEEEITPEPNGEEKDNKTKTPKPDEPKPQITPPEPKEPQIPNMPTPAQPTAGQIIPGTYQDPLVVAPTQTPADEEISASTSLSAVAISDIRSALWEIAENVRKIITEPLMVIPVMPEMINGSQLAPAPQLNNLPLDQTDRSIEIPVMIDGFEVGRAVYDTWNRRTGGGLNI